MKLTIHDIKNWLYIAKEKINEEELYLTNLDKLIGDGDHGTNMVRGFNAIIDQLQKESYHTVSDLMLLCARSFMTTVGGASGVLYASAFLMMGKSFQSKKTIDRDHFLKGLEEAIRAIEHRGNVSYGEKTMLDVWTDVTRLFQQSKGFPQAEQIDFVAKKAMENTRYSLAKKGKAVLYEESSIGHIDPGAASAYYLFKSLAKVFKEKGHE